MGIANRDAGVVLGIPIDRKSLVDVVQESMHVINRRVLQRVFACANPRFIGGRTTGHRFYSALTHADLVVVDGVGASLVASWAGCTRATNHRNGLLPRSAERTTAIAEVVVSSSLGHLSMCLDLLPNVSLRSFPSLTLCGTLSPPYGNWNEMKNHRMVKVINDAKPDVLWVGMTAPKQEKWVEANRQQLNVPVIGSIGAVFDFYAGTYSRAPKWVCDIGLEWAYRFIREPRRMWRRNFVSAPKLIWLVLRRHLYSGHTTSIATDHLSDSAKNIHQDKKAA